MKQILLVLWILLLACSAPQRLIETVNAPERPQDAAPTATAPRSAQEDIVPPVVTATLTPSSPTAEEPALTVTTRPTTTATLETVASGGQCSFNPLTDQLLDPATPEQWLEWVAKLSGAEPVTIAGEETRIETRFSPSMFDGQENARAFDWLLEQVRQWYPEEQIEVQPFEVRGDGETFTWKNLILTLPGQTNPDEIVLLTAHLDSTSNQPTVSAPGAEDNGSGVATLLEAARLLREARFARSLQIVWFTGEEQGLLGSGAFVEAYGDENIIGVVNLDMFGYDSDNDRCFELHVGTLQASQRVGECFVESIEAYQPELEYDFIEQGAIDLSDHGSFWEEGIGAIEVLEDLIDHDLPNGCADSDPTPHYHTTRDTVDKLNPETAFAIAQAALATVIGLAGPLP